MHGYVLCTLQNYLTTQVLLLADTFTSRTQQTKLQYTSFEKKLVVKQHKILHAVIMPAEKVNVFILAVMFIFENCFQKRFTRFAKVQNLTCSFFLLSLSLFVFVNSLTYNSSLLKSNIPPKPPNKPDFKEEQIFVHENNNQLMLHEKNPNKAKYLENFYNSRRSK